jgi:hypothetical protein
LGTPIVGATAISDASGNYYCSTVASISTSSAINRLNLIFNMGYILKFPLTSGTKLLTTNDLGGNDLSDSGAGTDGKITFTIGSAGQNNHTLKRYYMPHVRLWNSYSTEELRSVSKSN